LKLERGKRVALAGESGCGKSTLLALLRGLYEPEAGCSLLLDGRVAEWAALNETTALLPQEPEIFENTILYNNTLGLPLEESAVREATEAAHFADVVAELPKGSPAAFRRRASTSRVANASAWPWPAVCWRRV